MGEERYAVVSSALCHTSDKERQHAGDNCPTPAVCSPMPPCRRDVIVRNDRIHRVPSGRRRRRRFGGGATSPWPAREPVGGPTAIGRACIRSRSRQLAGPEKSHIANRRAVAPLSGDERSTLLRLQFGVRLHFRVDRCWCSAVGFGETRQSCHLPRGLRRRRACSESNRASYRGADTAADRGVLLPERLDLP